MSDRTSQPRRYVGAGAASPAPGDTLPPGALSCGEEVVVGWEVAVGAEPSAVAEFDGVSVVDLVVVTAAASAE